MPQSWRWWRMQVCFVDMQATLPPYSGVKGATGGRYRGDSASGATEVLHPQIVPTLEANQQQSHVIAHRAMQLSLDSECYRASLFCHVRDIEMMCSECVRFPQCSRRAPRCSTGLTRRFEHASTKAHHRIT